MARHPRVRDFRGSTAAGLWLPRAPVDGGRLAALLDTWPRRYTAWDRPQPATTCLLEVHDAPGFVPSEEPGPWPASLAQALEVPVAWFWVDVSSDPSVIASSYDAKGARRWRKVGGIEVYRKMVREHARDAPVEVEDFALRPAMDFVVSRWRAAGGPTSRGWVYLPPPPVSPPPPPFAPSHDEETVVAFAGRGERLEALILDALGPKAWAIHRLAPSATLVRLFGASPGLALAPGVRKRLAAVGPFGRCAPMCSSSTAADGRDVRPGPSAPAPGAARRDGPVRPCCDASPWLKGPRCAPGAGVNLWLRDSDPLRQPRRRRRALRASPRAPHGGVPPRR